MHRSILTSAVEIVGAIGLRYIDHVADRFDFRRDIDLETRMESATCDEGDRRWRIVTDGGSELGATGLVMATGRLSTTQRPQLPGLGTFTGEGFNTAEWPHEPVDFACKRVGVTGTGSSGTQLIPSWRSRPPT